MILKNIIYLVVVAACDLISYNRQLNTAQLRIPYNQPVPTDYGIQILSYMVKSGTGRFETSMLLEQLAKSHGSPQRKCNRIRFAKYKQHMRARLQ